MNICYEHFKCLPVKYSHRVLERRCSELHRVPKFEPVCRTGRQVLEWLAIGMRNRLFMNYSGYITGVQPYG